MVVHGRKIIFGELTKEQANMKESLKKRNFSQMRPKKGKKKSMELKQHAIVWNLIKKP